MKNRSLTLLAIIAAGTTVAPAAHAESFKHFLKSYVPRITRAFETGDASFFDQISTPDFTESEGGRTFTKKQAIDEMKASFTTTKKMTCKIKVVSFKQDGSKATAVTSLKASMVMKPAADRKTHTMAMELLEHEDWVKVGETWKIKSLSEDKPSKMWMDGKPVDPSKMAGG